MKLSYWVFTSGEKGIHGLDWGIKFASESFSDKYALDVEYRAALKNFSLNPRLKHPKKSGFIIIPFRSSEYIAGFILPGIDHGGRLNTSSVIALIHREIHTKIAVNELLERIYCANDIPNIARKNSDARPDFLTLGENITGKFPAFPENLRWPGRKKGYISVDGDLERLEITEDSEAGDDESDSRSKIKTGVIIAGLAVMAVIAGGIFVFSESGTTPKIDTSSQSQTAETENQNDASKQEDSKTDEPQKNIMKEIIARLESEDTKNFMTARSLVSFDISASMRSLPKALIDKNGITQTLINLFGDIKPEPTEMSKEGFMLKVPGDNEKKLPIETWRTKKTEIFTVITPENVSPAKSLQHDRLINSLKSSDVKEGWLTLYFMTSRENVKLAVFVNISDNVNHFLRLESKSDSLIPLSEATDLSSKISEKKADLGYRIIFSVPEKFIEGANDFNSYISAYIQQFSEEEY